MYEVVTRDCISGAVLLVPSQMGIVTEPFVEAGPPWLQDASCFEQSIKSAFC